MAPREVLVDTAEGGAAPEGWGEGMQTGMVAPLKVLAMHHKTARGGVAAACGRK